MLRPSWRTIRLPPSQRSSTGCLRRRPTENVGAGTGWMSCVTRIRPARRPTFPCAKPIDIEIMSSRRSMLTRPYDRFLREQIAGDLDASEAPPEQYEELVTATGFHRHFAAVRLRLGELSAPDDSGHDRHARPGRPGSVVGLRRCHDHKYDPVNAADYYALYGIFDSTRYAFPGSETDEPRAPRAQLLQ